MCMPRLGNVQPPWEWDGIRRRGRIGKLVDLCGVCGFPEPRCSSLKEKAEVVAFEHGLVEQDLTAEELQAPVLLAKHVASFAR